MHRDTEAFYTTLLTYFSKSDLSSKAMAMGAVHRQDLTSDVTHLVVGDPDTPKYKYVARNRIDVKVVDAGWVAAMHEKWITGEDIKISDFEEEHKFPPFLGLKISVTNISDSMFSTIYCT